MLYSIDVVPSDSSFRVTMPETRDAIGCTNEGMLLDLSGRDDGDRDGGSGVLTFALAMEPAGLPLGPTSHVATSSFFFAAPDPALAVQA